MDSTKLHQKALGGETLKSYNNPWDSRRGMRNWTTSKDGDTSRLVSSKDNCHQPLLPESNGLSENTACHHNNLVFLISFPCWVTVAPQRWSLYSGLKKKPSFPHQHQTDILRGKKLKTAGSFSFFPLWMCQQQSTNLPSIHLTCTLIACGHRKKTYSLKDQMY